MTTEAFREALEGFRRELKALPNPTLENADKFLDELARLARETRRVIEDFACMKDEEKSV